ncbi:MAG: hypothetical protein KIS88_03580 [Anaerolineales bacterium]|nr:hypothetical protein [Anaerolineales bacterium]
MSVIDTLLAEIFATRKPAFYGEFAEWLRGSRRFREFAHAYRNKIRAKLTNAKHAGSLDDLRAELHSAALLCGEQRFAVEYEHYAAAKQRGPDLTVLFKGHTTFNVEVRRVQAGSSYLEQVMAKKVKQLPAGVINVLWLAADGELAESRVHAAAATLLQHTQQKDDGYFAAMGYERASSFLKQYARLSTVLVWQAEPLLITNSMTRHTLPSDLQSALRRLSLAK